MYDMVVSMIFQEVNDFVSESGCLYTPQEKWTHFDVYSDETLAPVVMTSQLGKRE